MLEPCWTRVGGAIFVEIVCRYFLIKNSIQLNALKFYGGIWADLDVPWTGKICPYSFQEKAHPVIDLTHEVVLFTEYQGATGQCMRPSEETKPPATINLGFAYSFPKALFWEKCLEECLMHWTEGRGRGFSWAAIPQSEVRKQKHWNAHRFIVHDLAQRYGPTVVLIHEPLVAFPLFRELNNFPLRPPGDDQTNRQVGHGVDDISTHSYVVKVWTNIWSDNIIDTIVSFLKKVKAERAAPKQQVSRDASRARHNRNQIGEWIAREGPSVLKECGMHLCDCIRGSVAALAFTENLPDLAFAWDTETDAGHQRATICFAAMLTRGLEKPDHLAWPIDRMTATQKQLRSVLGMEANSTEVDDFISHFSGKAIKVVVE